MTNTRCLYHDEGMPAHSCTCDSVGCQDDERSTQDDALTYPGDVRNVAGGY